MDLTTKNDQFNAGLTDWFFITELEYVYCVVLNKPLNIIQVNLRVCLLRGTEWTFKYNLCKS